MAMRMQGLPLNLSFANIVVSSLDAEGASHYRVTAGAA